MEKERVILNQEDQRITTALKNPIVVRSGKIERFEELKDFGRIEVEYNHDKLFDEKLLKLMLLDEAIAAGGNAVYEYKLDENRKEVRKGVSDEGNPYYGKIVIFTGYGRAVLHCEKAKTHKNHSKS